MHILNNRHEYGPETETLQSMKHCTKGSKMSCWEKVYTNTLYPWSLNLRTAGQRTKPSLYRGKPN